MKELDVVVERYYQRRYPKAGEAQRAAFVRLLSEVEDPDIYAWAMGHAEPPSDYADLIAELRRAD